MDWTRFLSETNLTELQRMVNMRETRTTELENSLENNTEQLQQRFLSEKKQLNEVYTDLLSKKNSEIWILKKRNQELEYSNEELTKTNKQLERERKRRDEKSEEEVLHYANSLKKLEIEHQAALASARTQLEGCRIRLSDEESKSKELNRLYRESQDNLRYSLSSFQKLRADFNAYAKDKKAEIKQIKDRMSRKDYELGKLQEELKDKTERLASIFQKRLKHDQRKVENAVEFNTPSAVEKDFKSFFDGTRIDACETIENTLCSETDIDTQIRYLTCIIFVTAYEQMEEARGAAYDFFDNIARQLIDEAPRKSQELCIKRKEDGCSSTFPVTLEVSVERKEIEDSRDIVDSLMLSLKQTAHSCDLKCFEEDVKQVILRRWTNCLQEEQEMPLLPALSEKVITEVKDYIKKCIRLSWKIVTQVPPLTLEYSSLKFSNRMHSLTRLECNDERSEQGQSETDIACYLWPALVEHGGRVIFRGEVLCK